MIETIALSLTGVATVIISITQYNAALSEGKRKEWLRVKEAYANDPIKCWEAVSGKLEC